MTREEAIGILANDAQNAANIAVLLPKTKQDKINAFIAGIEALDMAIEALRRLTPQKPNLEGDGYADGVLVYDTWICPNCERHYEVDYDEYDHCPACGQAIDWGEEE